MQEKTPVEKQEETTVAPVTVTGESYWKVKPDVRDALKKPEQTFEHADVGTEYQLQPLKTPAAKPGVLYSAPLDKGITDMIDGEAKGSGFVKFKGKGLFIGFQLGGSDNPQDESKVQQKFPTSDRNRRGLFDR